MTGRYAVVEDRVVVNLVMWDGEADWRPERGEAVACAEAVATGWLQDMTGFHPPDAPTSA